MSATHVLQTDFYFHPSQIRGNRDERGHRAPTVSVLWLGNEAGDLFKVDQLMAEGSEIIGDRFKIVAQFVDATLRGILISTTTEANAYSIENDIAYQILDEEVVIQRSPFQGMKLGDLLKGAPVPVRIATGVSVAAAGLAGAGGAVAAVAGGAAAAGAAVTGGVIIVVVAGGILIIGSSVIAVEWLRRKFTP
jgi:hypothetical protein